MKSLHVFSSHATIIRDVNEETPANPKRLAEYLADEIRAEMSRRKINNRDLAKRITDLGESRSEPTISRLLRGTQRMTLDDAFLFAAALGTDLSTLTLRATTQREADGIPLPNVRRLTHREASDDGEH